jgi:SAM-dependent methyltransferase
VPQRAQWKLVLEALGDVDPSGLDVLDIGCGRAARWSRWRGCSTAGLCPVSTSARRTSRIAGGLPDLASARFQQGDACRLPYRDAAFDLVMNIESSCAYPDVTGFLRHVHRVLRPGGHFVFVDLVPAEARGGMRALLKGLGFSLLRERDVTAAVLRARADAASAEDAVFAGIAAASPETADFLDTYRAGPDTPMFRAMGHGAVQYMIYRLRRIDAREGPPPPAPDRGAMLRALLEGQPA